MSSLTDRVDELFTEWDKPTSPGCALGIYKEGRIIYKRGYGMADLKKRTPITSKTVLRIGSISKQFTAMCIALLDEQKKLSIEDDIKEYVPELLGLRERIAIKHLIYHTSGIPDYFDILDMNGKEDYDKCSCEDVLDTLSRQKRLKFKPGKKHDYSNSGYFLLSLIVERVSGKSLRKFAHGNIFRPLGMKDTHFHDDHTEPCKNLAIGYSPSKNGRFMTDMTKIDVVGDGGVFTTVEDFFLWDQNFYNNKLGEGRKGLIELVQTSGKLNSSKDANYAFGLEIGEHNGLPVIYHAGEFVGYVSQMTRFPEQRFTVAILSNLSSMKVEELGDKVADIYLADLY